jgi:hypothetical protein
MTSTLQNLNQAVGQNNAKAAEMYASVLYSFVTSHAAQMPTTQIDALFKGVKPLFDSAKASGSILASWPAVASHILRTKYVLTILQEMDQNNTPAGTRAAVISNLDSVHTLDPTEFARAAEKALDDADTLQTHAAQDKILAAEDAENTRKLLEQRNAPAVAPVPPSTSAGSPASSASAATPPASPASSHFNIERNAGQLTDTRTFKTKISAASLTAFNGLSENSKQVLLDLWATSRLAGRPHTTPAGMEAVIKQFYSLEQSQGPMTETQKTNLYSATWTVTDGKPHKVKKETTPAAAGTTTGTTATTGTTPTTAPASGPTARTTPSVTPSTTAPNPARRLLFTNTLEDLRAALGEKVVDKLSDRVRRSMLNMWNLPEHNDLSSVAFKALLKRTDLYKGILEDVAKKVATGKGFDFDDGNDEVTLTGGAGDAVDDSSLLLSNLNALKKAIAPRTTGTDFSSEADPAGTDATVGVEGTNEDDVPDFMEATDKDLEEMARIEAMHESDDEDSDADVNDDDHDPTFVRSAPPSTRPRAYKAPSAPRLPAPIQAPYQKGRESLPPGPTTHLGHGSAYTPPSALDGGNMGTLQKRKRRSVAPGGGVAGGVSTGLPLWDGYLKGMAAKASKKCKTDWDRHGVVEAFGGSLPSLSGSAKERAAQVEQAIHSALETHASKGPDFLAQIAQAVS